MEIADRIEEMIGPSLVAMGYDVVRVRLQGGDHPVLQVMAERQDAAAMTVDDCADISHTISALLDVEDPIKENYSLEVSSPGIDRPLVRERDFDKYAGFDARIETAGPVDGPTGRQRRFKGRLLGVVAGRVRIETAEGVADIPYADIRNAKLLITDELIAAASRQSGQAEH